MVIKFSLTVSKFMAKMYLRQLGFTYRAQKTFYSKQRKNSKS